MSKTYVNLVNGVLARLREDSVTDFNDTTYSTLISKFINDAKTEVESMHNWSALLQNLTISTTASQNVVTITDAGTLSELIEVYDYSNNNVVRQISYRKYKQILDYNNPQTGTPAAYCVEGQDSSQDPKLLLFPVPDSTYNLKVTMYVPQADLAASSTVLSIPWLPVELKAFALALDERGEDNSKATAFAQGITDRLILADLTKQGSENDWYVD